jgi:membrane protein DedA with SNARE-associated domain
MRAVMPGLAGVSRMHYPRFLAFNAAGGVVWGVGVVLLGYFAGSSYQTVARILGRASALALVVVVVAVLIVWRVRRRARERADGAPASEPDASDPADV